jgi:uroporphyrinogen decarboxylase
MLFLAALRGENRGRAPVWLMRQAGRYLAEYRALRERHAFKEMCQNPDLAVEVSLLPHRLLDVDAVIVFYDILIPVEGMGAPLVYTEEGPAFTEPVRDARALERLRPLEPERHTASILAAIRRLRGELGERKPVIGFAGAPFTLASYLVEGKPGAGAGAVKRLLFEDPGLLHRLLERLAEMSIAYLRAQVEAGAHAVQLFDTWAGELAGPEYREFALPYQRRVFEALRAAPPPVPAILFVRGGAHLVEEMAASGADALSLDWRASLRAARERLGPRPALQGNLDPAALFAAPERVRERARAILEDRRGDRAFIFNLGHGVLPGTPVESVRALIEAVKSFDSPKK